MAHWWGCGGSLVGMRWLIGRDVVAHWGMGWLIGGDMVAHW